MRTWKNNLRLACYWLVFTTLAGGWLSPVPAGTQIGPPVTFAAPQTVAVGMPFLVRFSSSEKLDAVKITWGDRYVHPSITALNGTHLALAILGTGMNAKPGMRTIIVSAKSAGEFRTYQKRIEIVPKKFPREALSVAPKMNKPPEEILGRIKRELAAMRKARRIVSAERKWQVPFQRPVKGVLLSRFGLRRTFNKETKRRHTGLDFRAPLGTDIAAIAAGRVVLVGDFYLPGNTVAIDHGNGIVSTSMHLSKVLISEGDPVKRGQVFGRSGATGRVTGAHLHLSVSVQGTAVDPAPLFDMGAPSESAALSFQQK
jgi:murein DD-endopeptidase MepM/ murein hydrolase activator NlpD